jgi:TetR/AcrR family transcriptional regulator, cholesterol catabolism regulator
MPRPVDPQLKERVLTTAERLFHERGYAAVSMQDLAEALGMRKASLYHYAPAGKERLFVEVMERQLLAHGAAVRHGIAHAGSELGAQLRAVAAWAIAHAPLGLLAVQHIDLPALGTQHTSQLEHILDEQLWQPIHQLFVAAEQSGAVRPGHADLYTGAFLSMLDGLTFSGARGRLTTSMEAAAQELVGMLLRGMAPT